MGNENNGRKMSKTGGHRKKLSDITNTPLLLKSRAYIENSELSKTSSAQLQEELANVKKVLAEKEQIIDENKRCMEKLWINYCRKTKQNDEIILHNSQLYKDLMQARDKLKVLQHENTQMSALYKVCKSEMQERLNEALEQVDRLTKLVEASAVEKALPANFNVCERLPCETPREDYAKIHGRSTLRKRESRSCREPSVRLKMMQSDEGGMCPQVRDDNAGVQGLGKVEECKELSLADVSAVSTTCRSEINGIEGIACEKMASEKRAHMKVLQQCTGKNKSGKEQDVQLPSTFHVSTRKSCERPLRRAVSSVGSYKEPPLNTKMRRPA